MDVFRKVGKGALRGKPCHLVCAVFGDEAQDSKLRAQTRCCVAANDKRQPQYLFGAESQVHLPQYLFGESQVHLPQYARHFAVYTSGLSGGTGGSLSMASSIRVKFCRTFPRNTHIHTHHTRVHPKSFPVLGMPNASVCVKSQSFEALSGGPGWGG